MGRRRNLRRRAACRTDHARRRRPWPRRFDRLVFVGGTREGQTDPGGARSESGADGDFDGISRSGSAPWEAKAAQRARTRRALPLLSKPPAIHNWPHGPDRPAAELYPDGLTAVVQEG